MNKKKIIIMGAAGRDFHNFNTYFRDNENYKVVAFTAAQIPDIHGKKYPGSLAGPLYPDGIPIYDETNLKELIRDQEVDQVVFAYSDVSYNEVMNKGSIVMSSGADFLFLGPNSTMLKAEKPVIATGAVRTGGGKSETSRRVVDVLANLGLKTVVVRHPMPYGDLEKQATQRFATIEDLKTQECTIEEMEEYEPHIRRGTIVYAGIDYQAILKQAQKEDADIILWDGGNNDMPFFKPDIMITLVDPQRAGHELTYFPGENSLRMADIVIVNKIESADLKDLQLVRDNIHATNPQADVVDACSPTFVDNPQLIRGKKVLVIEEGPTVTHGEVKYSYGSITAQKFGAAELVDPRPFAVGKIKETYQQYPNLGPVLPSMGYSKEQILDLEKTIDNVPCDLVVIATPIDLRRVIQLKKAAVKVRYELQEIGEPSLEDLLSQKVSKLLNKKDI